MKNVIQGHDPLVFRDGRPFGDAGSLIGGTLRWPMPSTIAGMIRYRIAVGRKSDFFSNVDGEQLEKIKKVSLIRTLPMIKADDGSWSFLFPKPADAMIVSGNDGQLVLYSPSYSKLQDGEGADLKWEPWYYPFFVADKKPVTHQPDLWTESVYLHWLASPDNAVSGVAKKFHELGFCYPDIEERMHTAVDPVTGSAQKGQLFVSQGIRLETKDGRQPGQCYRLGIGAEINGHDENDSPLGICHLGGERRTARVEELTAEFPAPPQSLQTSRFLRLILITPGDFGGWAPPWLQHGEPECERWVNVPETSITVRLVSAIIPRWQPVSGWDYENREPKATRQLVPAGAVYIIEVQDPASSPDLVKHIWGKSINNGLFHQDGYGCALAGTVNIAS